MLITMIYISGGVDYIFKCSKRYLFYVIKSHTLHRRIYTISLFFQVESSIWEYNKGADETDGQGLHTKTVALHFQIKSEHFPNNGGSNTPKMEIRCISTVGESVRYKVVYSTITKALTSNQLAQEGFRNSASKILLYTTTDEI